MALFLKVTAICNLVILARESWWSKNIGLFFSLQINLWVFLLYYILIDTCNLVRCSWLFCLFSQLWLTVSNNKAKAKSIKWKVIIVNSNFCYNMNKCNLKLLQLHYIIYADFLFFCYRTTKLLLLLLIEASYTNFFFFLLDLGFLVI